MFFLQKCTSIIELVIGGMTSLMKMINLSSYIKKTILKTINIQKVFDEMWYIVEYVIVDFFLPRCV